MRAKLPGYTIQLAGDTLIAQLLKPRWSALASIYSNITLPTARSDIARLVLVYTYGGFYFDISGVIIDYSVFQMLRFLEFDATFAIGDNDNLELYFFYAKPKSKIFEIYLDKIQKDLVAHYQKELVSEAQVPYNVLVLTGSARIYWECNKTHGKVFYPKSSIETFVRIVPKHCTWESGERLAGVYYYPIYNHYGIDVAWNHNADGFESHHWSRVQTRICLFKNCAYHVVARKHLANDFERFVDN